MTPAAGVSHSTSGSLPPAKAKILIVILGMATIRAGEDFFNSLLLLLILTRIVEISSS